MLTDSQIREKKQLADCTVHNVTSSQFYKRTSALFYCSKSLPSNTVCIMHATRSRKVNTSSKSAHFPSFLRFEYRNGASTTSSSLLSNPKLSPRTKYHESLGGKRRFPPINFRSPFLRCSCESHAAVFNSAEAYYIPEWLSFSTPLPSLSLSLFPSLFLWSNLPLHRPSLSLDLPRPAIPEFVITESSGATQP